MNTEIIKKIDFNIENLKKKVAQTSNYIKRAEKTYKNSLAKLEKQKLAIEKSKEHIALVKIKSANRMALLQNLIEKRRHLLKEGIVWNKDIVEVKEK